MDYVEHKPVYEFKFRGLGDRAHERTRQFMQSQCGPYEEQTKQFFVNDVDNPYSFDPAQPFHWIRGRQVGGRSLMWGRQTYRLERPGLRGQREGRRSPSTGRSATRTSRRGTTTSSDYIGVSGEALGLPQLPDGEFLPPMQLNCAERMVRDKLAAHFAGERMLTIGRCAILTGSTGVAPPATTAARAERGCITSLLLQQRST